MKLEIIIVLMLLSLSLNGQDNKITLETGGQIGIGIDIPTSTLDIRGKENDGTNAAIRIIDANPNMYTLLIDGNDIETYKAWLNIQANSMLGVSFTKGGGNVGVNMDPPENYKLAIDGLSIDLGDDLTETTPASLAIYYDQSLPMIFDNANILTVDHDLNINPIGDNNISLVGYNTSGTVSIGTTPELSKLTVKGPISDATNAAIKIISEAAPTKYLLMDGSQIKSAGANTALHLNNDNGLPVNIGTTVTPTGYLLNVGGKVISEEVRVELQVDWPDYVFDQDYPLKKLEELEYEIETIGHLPDVPSATQIAEEGHHLGSIQIKMLKKIEELTLYIIDLNKRISSLETENAKN